MFRFDKFMAERKANPVTNGHTSKDKEESVEPMQQVSPPSSNNRKQEAMDEDDLSDVVETPPPKKKRKAETTEDADAAFAAILQAQENSRARPTRGGVNKKPLAKKMKRMKKAKRSERNADEDDSTSDVVDKKVNRSGGFHVSLRCSTFQSRFHPADKI